MCKAALQAQQPTHDNIETILVNIKLLTSATAAIGQQHNATCKNPYSVIALLQLFQHLALNRMCSTQPQKVPWHRPAATAR